MTAPRWIVEALDAACDHGWRLPDERKDAVAEALFERLPIEAMIEAISPLPSTRVSAAGLVAKVAAALTEDVEVVTLTELYQDACRALDAAGVPYAIDTAALYRPLSIVDRIAWLAAQRPLSIDLQRVTAERDLARHELAQARRNEADNLHRQNAELRALIASSGRRDVD